MAEILASLDDINANLPSEDVPGGGAVVLATQENTALLQVSVARVVRAYLSRVIPRETMFLWDSPADTPEIIREAAAKMIAAHLWFTRMARTTSEIPDQHYSQKLYNQAMEILNGIISGSVEISDLVVDIDELTELDFYPTDSTDRAFSVGMDL